MMLPPLQECNAFLESEAKRLSASYWQTPKPIGRICYDLGVSIERGTQQGFKSYMIFPRRKDHLAKILLPNTGGTQPISSFHRFCVAHELAHFLLHKRYQGSPEGKSQYWQHEQICDRFARKLLLPQSIVTSRDLDKFLISLELLSLKYRVPLMQVAKADSDGDPSRLSFRIKKQGGGGLKVVSGSSDNGIGVGSVVKGTLAIKLLKIINEEISTISSTLTGGQISFLKQTCRLASYNVTAMRLEKTPGKDVYLTLQSVGHTKTITAPSSP